MNSHLVAVEVRVVSGASQRVQTDSLAFDELRLECLNRETVQRGSAVEQDRVAFGHLVENVPHFGRLFLDHLLRAADGVDVATLLEHANDERLEQHESHLLRKTTLVELEFRTDDDDGTTRVVHALAEQVLAETAAFTLEHVGQRFEGAVACAGDGAAMTTVVVKRVHSFLQHALFVADDDLGRLEQEQIPQTVVAVDDAAIEVVEVGRCETATFQRDERTQVGRDDGKHFKHHPLGTCVRVCKALRELEALREFLAVLLRFRRAHLLFEFHLRGCEINGCEHVANSLTTHAGAEAVLAVLVERLAVFRLGEELAFGERRVTWIDDEVILVIDHAFELAAAHVEHEADARRHALVEPDVRGGHGEFDVAHALTANAGQRDFDAAAVADDALVLDAFVFSARALPVARRTENALAEEAAFFGFERAVVDGLGIFDLALRPRTDRIGRCYGDGDRVEFSLWLRLLGTEDVAENIAHCSKCFLSCAAVTGGLRPFGQRSFSGRV